MNLPTGRQGKIAATSDREAGRLELIDHGSDAHDYAALRHGLERALAAAAKAEQRIAEQQGEINRLRTLSITDEATGLLNRRGFGEALDRAMERGRRFGETGVLLLIDLDGFKSVNDTFGHAAGDHVLTSVADTLRNSVRTVDDTARIGGDEFAVILNQTPRHRAAIQATSIEQVLNGLTVPWQGNKIQVGASVGSQYFGPMTVKSPDEVYSHADNNMYVRKKISRVLAAV